MAEPDDRPGGPDFFARRWLCVDGDPRTLSAEADSASDEVPGQLRLWPEVMKEAS